MTTGLVGSEMCIRDRSYGTRPSPCNKHGHHSASATVLRYKPITLQQTRPSLSVCHRLVVQGHHPATNTAIINTTIPSTTSLRYKTITLQQTRPSVNNTIVSTTVSWYKGHHRETNTAIILQQTRPPLIITILSTTVSWYKAITLKQLRSSSCNKHGHHSTSPLCLTQSHSTRPSP